MLNQILEEMVSGDQQKTDRALKELVGHTPFQVVIGALVGVGTAIVTAWVMGIL